MVTAEGVLFSVNQASVTPKISAPVRIFHVKRGDHVAAGQVVAELENRDLAAAVADAKAVQAQAESTYRNTAGAAIPEELAKAEREADSAKQEMDAAKTLLDNRQKSFSDGVLARKNVDEANLAYVQARNQNDIAQRHLETLKGTSQTETLKNLQAQVDSAKAKTEAAEVQESYSRITSPINGVVTDRPLYEGEMASAGTPLLTIMDLSHVIARANVPAAQLRSIKAGNAATIEGTEGMKTAGRVTVVSPALDPNSTTAEVWVEAVNPNEQMRPGATVNVAILVETVKNAIVVPAAALLPNAEGMTVLMSVGTDSLAHERAVDVGIRQADKVQIVRGLEPGEKVITVGGLGLEDKAKVKIVAAGEKEEADEPSPGGKDEKDKGK
jgi:RND family efflux transporter MFP subunit